MNAMKIFGYVIGGDFYKTDSPSLSEEMKQSATPVVRAEDVLPQANVIKSVCEHRFIELSTSGRPRIQICEKCKLTQTVL